MTGGSTYTVSLPKEWADEVGLEPGDGIRIDKQATSLLMAPTKMEEEKRQSAEVKVGPDEGIDELNREILSLYLVGYNVINVRSQDDRLDSSRKSAIKEFVRNKLVGAEIISESMDEVVLKILLSYSELSAKDALRRMYRVAESMQENAMIALKESDKELARDVIDIDDEVDRFQMYLIREIKAAMQDPSLMNEIGLETARECLGYRLVSNSVERIGDHASSIAENVLEMETRIDEESLEMLQNINSLAKSIVSDAVEALFVEDYEKAENVIQELEKIYVLEREINNFLEEEQPSEAIKIRLVLESIRRIAEYGSDVAELVLNLTVKS